MNTPNKKSWLYALLLLPALHAPPAAAVESWEVTATDVLTGVIPIGAFWYTHNIDDRNGRDQYLWSMGTTLTVITTARVLFNDHDWGQRPNGHPYGFPSGHIAFLGSAAAFVQDRYGWKAGIPAWAATAYTAYVRVEDDHHRWRDVIVAAAFAQGASWYFVERYPGVKVLPFSDDDGAGLRVDYQFE